jgi:2,3-bisphosphoglycerate-dependent phosphoglycerate mutase
MDHLMTMKRLIAEQPTVLYLVRHGQTDWNVEKRFQGQTDIPLNDTGREEARKLSDQLKGEVFDAIYSSDLKRATETASLITLCKPKTDARLRERHFGHWEGKLQAEFYHLPKEDRIGFETDEEVLKRAFEALTEITTRHPGQKVLVVTHGGLQRNLIIDVLGLKCSADDIVARNLSFVQLAFSQEKWLITEMHGIRIPEEAIIGTE